MNELKCRSIVSAHKLVFLILAAAVTTSAGVLLLTAGSGVTSTTPARASFVDPTDIKFKVKGGPEDVIHVPEAADTVMHQITIQPAVNNGGVIGHTGWHSHPGPVVVLVTAGEMSFYDGDDPTCTVRTYTAGQAFIDSGQGHVHIARNEGTVPLVLSATYFDVPPPPPPPASQNNFRIDAPAPGNCPF